MSILHINTPIKVDCDSWAEFKKYVDGTYKTLPIQYIEADGAYTCFAVDGPASYKYIIYTDDSHRKNTDSTQNTADRTDFETNYKAGANGKINRTYVEPQVGLVHTLFDRVEVTCNAADSMAWSAYSVVDPFYLEGVNIQWHNCEHGDYVHGALLNAAGKADLNADLVISDTEVFLPDNGTINYYHPTAAGATHLEIHSDNDAEILEVIPISSVDIPANKIVLATGVASAYTSGKKLYPRVNGFHPVRGTHGTDGGFGVVGSNTFDYTDKNNLSNLVNAGLLFYMAIQTGSGTGTRSAVMNIIGRQKLV